MSTSEITKSPREVCTVAVYFLLGSITVGGGVVRCSMQVTISLSQAGANEVVAGAPPPASHAASASSTSAEPRIRFTRETLREVARGSPLRAVACGQSLAPHLGGEPRLASPGRHQHCQRDGQSRDDDQGGGHSRCTGPAPSPRAADAEPAPHH